MSSSSDESVLFVGKTTPAMIPPTPLQEGRTLGSRALLVVGDGASCGWRRPSAV
ncbi:UNVERIFIED_CONTAM: hypothetical protein Slati_2242200 [Sesamum latifolium]|uniref:Uncharacterized protein n=1 Tax=Sesamum latifolium TaxID=2727402 RepID=A0AAW2WU88_9LAMI